MKNVMLPTDWLIDWLTDWLYISSNCSNLIKTYKYSVCSCHAMITFYTKRKFIKFSRDLTAPLPLENTRIDWHFSRKLTLKSFKPWGVLFTCYIYFLLYSSGTINYTRQRIGLMIPISLFTQYNTLVIIQIQQ